MLDVLLRFLRVVKYKIALIFKSKAVCFGGLLNQKGSSSAFVIDLNVPRPLDSREIN